MTSIHLGAAATEQVRVMAQEYAAGVDRLCSSPGIPGGYRPHFLAQILVQGLVGALWSDSDGEANQLAVNGLAYGIGRVLGAESDEIVRGVAFQNLHNNLVAGLLEAAKIHATQGEA